MSLIRVVTSISPITAISEDFSNLIKPSDLGKPVQVHKCSVVDPRTGMKYIVESTVCIGKINNLENDRILGLTNLTDSNNTVHGSDGNGIGMAYSLSLPKKLSAKKVSQVLNSTNGNKLEKNMCNPPRIKLHLNLKKIREDSQKSLLFKKRVELLKPLFKYFVNSECLICGIFLDDSSKNSVLMHMMKHTKFGTFVCQICDNKCFSSAEALYSHSNQHLDVKPYVCGVCNNAFSRKYFLSLHYVKKHPYFSPKSTCSSDKTVIKQKVPTCFACTICKVNLTSWEMLVNHKNAHFGKENYLCLFCNKSFSASSLLRYHSHIRIISKCSSRSKKAFSSIYKLQKRELMRLKNQYRCKICGKKFNFKHSLVQHVQLLHS